MADNRDAHASAHAVDRTESGEHKHSAGAFDIRNIIGMLMLIYAVLLVIASFLPGSGGDDRTGGINANLWTGLALLVVAAVFMLWARLRPIMVPEGEAEHDAENEGGRPPGH